MRYSTVGKACRKYVDTVRFALGRIHQKDVVEEQSTTCLRNTMIVPGFVDIHSLSFPDERTRLESSRLLSQERD